MLFLSPAQQAGRSVVIKEMAVEGLEPAVAARRLLELDPEDGPSYRVLGQAALDAGDLAEAERLFWRALELQPFGCLQWAGLADVYARDPATAPASALFQVQALRAATLAEEVPAAFVRGLQAAHPDRQLDYEDVGTYLDLALEQEAALQEEGLPEELARRLRPYQLVQSVAVGVMVSLVPDVVREVLAEPACVTVLHAAVRAWARDEDSIGWDIIATLTAILGEAAGPELLPELWELSEILESPVFLHTHWALWRLGARYPGEAVAAILAQLPGAPTGLRCGMAEQLGLMRGVEGAPAALLALMQDFAQRAHERDAPYLLAASAAAFIALGHPARSKQLFAQYERSLDKEGRRWLRESEEPDGSFVSQIAGAKLPELDIIDVCVGQSLMDDDDEEDLDDVDDDLWDDDEDDEELLEEEAASPPVKPGRNDPCWCGSGRKYKKCHLAADEAEAREAEEAGPDDPVRGKAMEGLLGVSDSIRRRTDLMAAGLQYFGSEVDQDRMQESSEQFLLWYLFDYRPQPGSRTVVEEYLRRHNTVLSPETRELLEAWRDSRYGLFTVESVETEARLKDVVSGDIVLAGTENVEAELVPGSHLLARIEVRGGRAAFSEDPIVVPPESLPQLESFIAAETAAGGQAPAEFMRANIHRLHLLVKRR